MARARALVGAASPRRGAQGRAGLERPQAARGAVAVRRDSGAASCEPPRARDGASGWQSPSRSSPAIVGVGLAGLAYWQRGVAVEQQQLAEERAVAEKAAKDEAERNFHVATATMQGVFTEMAEGLQDVEGVPIESRQRMLDAADKAAEPLFKAAPDDAGVQRIRAAIRVGVRLALRLEGRRSVARGAAYDKALKIARDILARRPDDWQSLGILALLLGRARRLQGVEGRHRRRGSRL